MTGATASRLAAFAIAAQVILLAAAWLLPLAPDYTLVLTVALILAGAGTVALAAALRRLTEGVPGSLVGTMLVGLYGAGAILSAIFPTERVDTRADLWLQATPGLVDLAVSLVCFPAMIAGMFVLSRTFSRTLGWRSLVRWSVLLPGSALALLFAQEPGPRAGLMQRLLITAISIWLIVVASRARALAWRLTGGGPPPLRTTGGRRVRPGALHRGRV